MNHLLSIDFFDVYYERPLIVGKEKKFPDFTIYNKKTKTVFHWEHFGINDESEYGEHMTAKLQWYREKGYRSVEEGGRLAVTIYQNEEQFFASVLKLIELLKTK